MELSHLALSSCTASDGSSPTDLAVGIATYGSGVAFLDGVFTFTSTTYLAIRHYGGRSGRPYCVPQGSVGITLSFLKI
jgi:hypothetical protein